jgi:hypothetical protein
MISLEDALLVLKGWEGRRLRIAFEGTEGVRRLHAKCDLYGTGNTGASFALGEEFAFEVALSGCLVEYGEPRNNDDDGGTESALIFVRAGFSLTVMLLAESD